VAAELIARDGLEAATVRRIAAELGYSTTVITNYFNDKQELLLLAYRYVADRGVERFGQALARHPGDLVAALQAMTVTGAEAHTCWRVYLAFWERAGHDPVFAAEQRKWVESTLGHVIALIQDRCGEREDSRAIAMQLIALVHGIAMQTLFDAGNWPAEVVREVLAGQVRFLLG